MDPSGTRLGHRNIVRRGLDKAFEDSNLPKLTWHDLRHVAASIVIAEGASVAYVSRVLGHANPRAGRILLFDDGCGLGGAVVGAVGVGLIGVYVGRE
jgi:integrase